MANYYKTISCKNLLLSDGNINQKKGSLCLALDSRPIIEIKNNDAFLNSKKILTSDDIFMVISFGSGIYTTSGMKYIRYNGNSDSGYDKNLRIANIFNTQFYINIKRISIQKGSSGESVVTIPAINYTAQFVGNFFTSELDINIPINTKIYVQIDGEPSLETSVDIYYIKYSSGILDTRISDIKINNEIVPVFGEIFKYNDDEVSTKYPILFC